MRTDPEGVKALDKNNRTPLLFAAGNDAPVTVVQALLKEYPQGAEQPDIFGRLPLHAAAAKYAPLEVVQTLLRQHRGGAQHVDNDGYLPLHDAILSDAAQDVLYHLVDAYPEGALQENESKKNPCKPWENSVVHEFHALQLDEKGFESGFQAAVSMLGPHLKLVPTDGAVSPMMYLAAWAVRVCVQVLEVLQKLHTITGRFPLRGAVGFLSAPAGRGRFPFRPPRAKGRRFSDYDWSRIVRTNRVRADHEGEKKEKESARHGAAGSTRRHIQRRAGCQIRQIRLRRVAGEHTSHRAY